MSAGPGVHINLCCNISPKSGRETLSNGRACSILELGGCVAQTWSHAFEAAFIAQTVVRAKKSALQNGFKDGGSARPRDEKSERRRYLAQYYRLHSGDTAARQHKSQN